MTLNDIINAVVDCYGCIPDETEDKVREALGCYNYDELVEQILNDMEDSPDTNIFRVHVKYDMHKHIYSEFLEDVFEGRNKVNLRKYNRFCYHMGIGEQRRLEIIFLSDDSTEFVANILSEVALC